jgi:hypothetical protein
MVVRARDTLACSLAPLVPTLPADNHVMKTSVKIVVSVRGERQGPRPP